MTHIFEFFTGIIQIILVNLASINISFSGYTINLLLFLVIPAVAGLLITFIDEIT